ncbi:MAG TPA: hypothetical protein DC047_02520 [Blastocatellia bacterium]|nr:hypothetical protein [Blastocatellia bacterium]
MIVEHDVTSRLKIATTINVPQLLVRKTLRPCERSFVCFQGFVNSWRGGNLINSIRAFCFLRDEKKRLSQMFGKQTVSLRWLVSAQLECLRTAAN